MHTLTMQLLAGAAIVTTQEAWVKLHTPSASMGISAIKYLNKLYIVSPVTCSLPCNTSIRLIPQTYLKVAMWAANIVVFTSSLSLLCQHCHYGELQYTWTIFICLNAYLR